MTLHGREWDCATDGAAILLMAAPCVYPVRPNTPDIQKLFDEQIAKPRHRGAFDKIRAWASMVEPRETCSECKGHGCAECDGDGWFWSLSCARFFGVPINRVLLWRFTNHLAADEVRVAEPLGPALPIAIEAPDWRVVLMPLRDSEGCAPDHFPAGVAT